MSAKTPVKLGGVGAGSATDDIPKVLAATIGFPFQLVSGYKGTADVRLAFNSGEVQGHLQFLGIVQSDLEQRAYSGDIVIVLQTHRKIASGSAEGSVGHQLRQNR